MTLTLRRATFADAQALFGWRNDPATRAASHQTDALCFDSHAAWLAATLENSKRTLWVAEEHGEPVGTVRIDLQEDGSMLLCWSVAPHARGQGVATRMVSMVMHDIPAERVVHAEIKVDNIASVKVAEAAGMRLSGQEGVTLHFVRGR